MKNRDSRDHDQQQLRDIGQVFNMVSQGLMTPMAARPAATRIIAREIMTTQDAEISALRELIRGLREYFVESPCHCEKLPDGDLCDRCAMLGWLDRGLAKIGENKHD